MHMPFLIDNWNCICSKHRQALAGTTKKCLHCVKRAMPSHRMLRYEKHCTEVQRLTAGRFANDDVLEA
jgi:hypothetical protein